MKILYVFLSAVVAFTVAAPKQFLRDPAQKCTDECVLPDCRCSSTKIPGDLDVKETPQFVLITFDDAITALNVDTFFKPALFDKVNPDGCNISATHFASHEYTDYNKVHELYLHGHEIALHSITHSALTTYWQEINKTELLKEFGGDRELVSHFTNIPIEAVKGMRLPFLQLDGDNSFEVVKEAGLTYDCSWPTQSHTQPGYWPYTLDYKSTQDCPIGPCPESSIPGVWVVPMIDWHDIQGTLCAMVDACQIIPDNEDDVLEWIKDNFNKQYEGNRAPFGFYAHPAWFSADPMHFSAFVRFVDYLQTLEDVFIVNIERMLEWVRNPVPIGSENWPKCPEIVQSTCSGNMCHLMKGDEERYMTVCTEECPNSYPWLDNPLGE